MAGSGGRRKIVLPPSLIPKPPVVRTIPAPSGSSAKPFNLQEEQKRWVVIGICLNKILLPTLRNFLSPQMKTHYATLKVKHNIDKQSHAVHLAKEGKRSLNYGSINNNEVNYKKKLHLYDYNVRSEVDLAKLYLQPFMAKFTGFDDTCDLSAVLGILASAAIFSAPIQSYSNDVRNDVRNEWGHCNFTNWNALKFAKCFQLMESLVRALCLPKADEKKVTDELKDWENKGLQLCMGKPVDADLVKFIEVEVSQLEKTVKLLEKTQSDEAQRISNGLQSVLGSIEEFKTEINKTIESLKESQEITNERVDELSKETTSIAKDVGSLKDNERILTNKVDDIGENQVELTKRVDEGEEKYASLSEALQAAIETRSGQQTVITFQAPNRIPCFHGRAEELEMLAKTLEKKSAPCNLTAIYGLGGTGKTSLALEHIWRNISGYIGGVFWISGEDRRKFELSILEMAQQIGTFEEDFQRTLSKTISWLQQRKEYWCLVMDNFDELELSPDMIKLLSGHWQRNVKGHILITTRREKQRLEDEFSIFSDENCIGLKNLSEDESIGFMKTKTGNFTTKDDDVIRQLVSELGTLPLALDQAAAFIKNRKVSFSQYIDYYKECKLKIFQDAKSKARYPVPQDMSMDRIAIHTTWQMNFDYISQMSEDYGIGQAAALVMEVAAFLSPDDIPQEVINVGLPPVESEDFSSCLSTPFGRTDIVDILTSFSLFQRFTTKSFSVHRLVQEVIRSRISLSHLKEVLHCACKMLCYAFAKTTSPNEVCNRFEGDTVFSQDDVPSLRLWGKLGLHASVLQNYMLQTCQKDVSHHEVLYTEEFATLLNEASLYLSVCRQKVEAMELQKSKLEIMTHLEEPTNEKLEYLNYFDIPLKNIEFKLISHCMASQESVAENVMALPEDIDKANELREKGNAAVKERNYDEAIDRYTKALALHNDSRLYNNRALCYLKLKKAELALQDCESCLEQEPRNSKALKRKAWALHDLTSKDEKLIGKTRAAAAFASYVDPIGAKEKQFQDMFPDLLFEEVYNPLELTSALLLAGSGVTILLHEGSYELFGAFIDKDLQFLAPDKGVVVKLKRYLTIMNCSFYAEGIVFAESSGSILCAEKEGLLNLFKCKMSGGFKSCEDFPDCNGGIGCVASDLAGRQPCDRRNKFGEPGVSGVCGEPCIDINFGATGFIQDCEISRCGGGGILCQGKTSTVSVVSCRVHSNHQVGLEARNGGCLISENNDVYGNKHHGILIGPDAGKCNLINNQIFENHKEGVFVFKTMDQQVAIDSNRIYHNNAFGISLDRCQVEIKENKIFENYFHGIHAKTLTTAIIEKNDIYNNKCGGIHIGINFSARLVVKSNIVRDNSGSWIVHGDYSHSLPGSFASKTPSNNQDGHGLFYLPEGETEIYTLPPIIEDNDVRNNEPKAFHPKEKIQSVQSVCAFCHNSRNLKRCLKCNTAMYCSSDCQKRHWNKHRVLCTALKDQYSVTVELLDLSIRYSPGDNVDLVKQSGSMVNITTFGPHLKGIGTGPKPNPKSKRRFIVKIQTGHLNSHPLQNLCLYDKSTSINNVIQSPEIFHVIMECGVVGQMVNFTSKKAYFYATFAIPNYRKKLNIYLDELAPYQDW